MRFRLQWQDWSTFVRLKPNDQPKTHYQDFDSSEAARAEAVRLKAQRPGIVTSVTQMHSKPAPMRPVHIDSNHPGWQGERRMTR